METKEQQNNKGERKDEETATLAKENKVNRKGKMEKEADERDKMTEGNAGGKSQCRNRARKKRWKNRLC